MQLYILRHALADFRSAPMGGDPPVTKEGLAETTNVIEVAKQMGFKPSTLVSSPLIRAKQTAELAKRLSRLKKEVVVDECLYGDKKPGDVLKFLTSFDRKYRIAFVSHMPLLAELLYNLIGGHPAIEQLNGSIAAVSFDGKASEGRGKLIWLVQPGGRVIISAPAGAPS